MGKKKKQEENIILPEQISIFDLLEMQKTEKRTIKCDSVTKTAETCTRSVKSYSFQMKKLTDQQLKVLDKYKDNKKNSTFNWKS